MRNMACKVIGNVGIAVHTSAAPTDEEWQDLLDKMKKSDLSKFRGLSFTEGGAPTSTQRKLLNDLLTGYQPASAIVTASAMVRGVVTALAWFNPKVKAFSPDRLDDAMRHLQIAPSEFPLIRSELQKLKEQLASASNKPIRNEV